MSTPELAVPRRDDWIQECEVCFRKAEARRHPCRFEVACSCWSGKPCDGSGRVGRK